MPLNEVRPPGAEAGGRGDKQLRTAGGRSVLRIEQPTHKLNRCGRVRRDGQPCRTPVARPGLACYWHTFSDQISPGGRWPFDIPNPGHCPVCGAEAVYHKTGADRFFHLDGSDNRHCWRQIMRGALWGGGHDG